MNRKTKPRILVVDDEANMRRVLQALVEQEGFEARGVADGAEALALMDKFFPHAVLSDLKMPRMDGMELLRRLSEEHPDVPVIMLTAHGTVDTAVEALKRGAFDYLTKPFEKDEIANVIKKAAAHALAALKEAHAPAAGAGRKGIVGRHPLMAEIFRVVDKVADSPSTVFITGESGTGKELIAQALHDGSSRRKKPLIKINCAAIPATLIESELFGYEKGAFTGAVTSKPGRFELADGGTLFLDEVGEIPLEMQVKLLRVLQEHEFERVGGVRSTRVDVRLIAATNRDIEALVREQKFREDLFYRLNVVPIRLPSLRERKEDIPLLAEHFLEKYRERLGRAVKGIGPEAMEYLCEYSWPGNIRELENVIERAILFAESDTVSLSDLPVLHRSDSLAEDIIRLKTGGTLKERVKQATMKIERDLIARALEENGGNITRTARKLGISRKGLQIKMKELELR